MSIADKLIIIAENEQKVFDAGLESGREDAKNEISISLNNDVINVANNYISNPTNLHDSVDAQIAYLNEKIPEIYEKGIEDGKQTENETFWETYQESGNRTIYENAFGNWIERQFYPLYSIKPRTAYMMFKSFGARDDIIINLVERLGYLGIDLDFSECADLQYCFQQAYFSHVGIIDARSCSDLRNTFNSSQIRTIEKLVVYEKLKYTTAFYLCLYLKDILSIEGAIGNDINFKDSPLSKGSIVNVINALSDTVKGNMLTLSLKAVNDAFETVEGMADGSSSNEWAELIENKTNWTIALV